MKANILLIDDDKNVHRIMQIFALQHREHKIYYAPTIENALEHLSAVQFDIIYLDVWLKGDCGLDHIHAIKKKSKAPLHMLTSDDTEKTRKKAMDAGARSVVLKPYLTIGTILEHINQLNEAGHGKK